MRRAGEILMAVVLAVLLSSAACYNNPGSGSDAAADAAAEEAEEQPDAMEGDHSEDIWEDCRQVTPTVLAVDFDTSHCNGQDQYLKVLVDEAVPYCGEVLAWWQEIEWHGALEPEITPHAYTCSETWQPCDPGETNRVEIDIPVTERGVFTVRIGEETYAVECAWDDCFPEHTALEEVYIDDGREHRLFGVDEDIGFTAVLSTEYCGCSEFPPFDLDNPVYDDDHYYMTNPLAIVCYNRCCLDCGCVDTGEIGFTLEGRGLPFVHEVIFYGGDSADIRGFIADPMADPLSECAVQPAQIVSVDGPPLHYYRRGEPLSLEVTTAYFSYPSPSCCETFTGIAYDLIRPEGLRIFAFSGLCPECDDAPCPQEHTTILSIPPTALFIGAYTVYNDFTGEELFSFRVTSAD